ncbi:TPA: hypothetical protein U1D13_001906 [Streptococcus suis]|nr:hypothetical protein [Streptococcus suis]HEM3627246.1 hypothetical protein [Streptococcus suis]HEM3640326.1 hypothetical protein [Streptococcus suis]HEM3653371.1 hypothetical protein [Streptococcus suis]HEM3715834.1 hypothetical protein [Streptococcus suis]
MIDEVKVKRLRIVAGGIAITLLLLMSFGLGQMTAPSRTKQEEAKTSTQATEEQKLSYEEVEEFLIAYYTKKDLGTNRNRYKPFMTETLYNQEVTKEEEPVNQTYKGYVVDYTFKQADIYINTETNIAIVQVDYTNTLLEKKENYDKAQKNVRNQSILKLTYTVDDKGKLKLNNIQPAVLSLSGEEETNLPDYGTVGNTVQEQEGENNNG